MSGVAKSPKKVRRTQFRGVGWPPNDKENVINYQIFQLCPRGGELNDNLTKKITFFTCTDACACT